MTSHPLFLDGVETASRHSCIG